MWGRRGGGDKNRLVGPTKVLFEASGYIRIYNHGKYRKLSKGGSGQGSRKKQKSYKRVNNDIILLGLVANNIYMVIMI